MWKIKMNDNEYGVLASAKMKCRRWYYSKIAKFHMRVFVFACAYFSSHAGLLLRMCYYFDTFECCNNSDVVWGKNFACEEKISHVIKKTHAILHHIQWHHLNYFFTCGVFFPHVILKTRMWNTHCWHFNTKNTFLVLSHVTFKTHMRVLNFTSETTELHVGKRNRMR